MRQVIRDIQKEVGITTIYVTHDQEEAMAISDRIAVMNEGVIQHIGTPEEIYHRPSNRFVANFIGRTNFLEATYDAKKKRIALGDYLIPFDNLALDHDSPVLLSVRPEDFIPHDTEKTKLTGIVRDSYFLGINIHQVIELDHNHQHIEVIRESFLENILPIGRKVSLEIKTKKMNVFSQDGSKNLIAKARS